ncbi:MAG: two-component regulator propeller domain-containing protein [Nibricoccus sp.]
MLQPTPNLFRLFCAVLCLATTPLYADYRPPADYTLREWTESQGLPSNEASAVFQDGQGYLWVITNAGPARFDGNSFEPQKMPPEVASRGMIILPDPTNRTATLVAPANLNAGSEGAVTAKTDGFYIRDASGEFRFQQEPLLTGKTVRTVFAMPDGTLWLGCDDGTLLRRKGAEAALFPAPETATTKRNPILAIDQQQRLWAVIGAHIYRLDGSSWTLQYTEPSNGELRLCSSQTGGPWLLTREALFKWQDDRLVEIARLPELMGAHFVQTALEDTHGILWLGTRSQGLFRYTNNKFLHLATGSEDITAIWADTEDDLWVTTNGGGLNRLRPKAHHLFDQASGLKDNYSYTVAEDASGAIWLGNRDGGAARIVDGTVDPISRRANWRPFSAMSVSPANDGGMWITSGIGIYRTDPSNTDKLQRQPAIPGYKSVRASFTARNGDYWFSVDPDRLVRWRAGQLTLFGHTEGFDGREIRAIAEDSEGVIWLGAADGRLYRSKGEKFERVPFADSDNAGAIQVLRFEADGTLLAGTTRVGVLIFLAADRLHPKALHAFAGLPSSNITQILADDHERYWFGSRNGIFWVHRAQVQAFALGKSARVHAITLGVDDGLPELTCLGLFQPAAWKSRDGKLWFATRRGVLCTDPALTTGDDHLDPVTVSAMTCDGQSRTLSDKPRIRSTVRKTEIRLSVLCLSTPERVQVRYQLEGFDNDWVVLKDSRVATYPRLPPGTYVFRAMASKGNGIWNEQSELLTLTVTPPWWQSLWARVLYLLILVVVVGVVVRARSHRRLSRRLVDLERERAIEQERTRIARNIHDELGASLTHISLLTQAAQQNQPAQNASFDKIYEATHEITRAMDEIVWAVNPKCDDLESLVYYIGNFAQNLLSAAGIRCRLDLPSAPPPLRLPSPVRHNLFLCCKEALNNAVKHAKAELVSIAITVEGQTLRLTVADNGRGLAPAVSNARTRLTPASGLENLRQRMTEIGGTCEFATQPGGGLAVTFSITLSVTA